MTVLESGSGDRNKAIVNEDFQLEVRSVMESEMEFVSHQKGLGFTWTSEYTTAGVNEEVIYLKVTSNDKTLHLKEMHFSSDIACDFIIKKVTSGTAAGSAATEVNLNFSSGVVAEVTAYGNASVTGSLAGDTIIRHKVQAGTSSHEGSSGAIIMKTGDEIAVTATSTAATISATLIGYFETAGDI